MKSKPPLLLPYLLAFGAFAIFVGAQGTRCLDLTVTVLLQRVGSGFFDYLFCYLLVPGSIEFSSIILLAVCWRLYRKYEWSGVVLYPLIFITLSVVEFLLKQIINCPGPGPAYDRSPFHLGIVSVQTPFSFPSGHAFRSVFILGIWYQWLKRLGSTQNLSVKIQKILIAALFFGINTGLVYLGAHWLSDVIGGCLLAAIGLCLISEPVHPELRPA